MSKKETELHLSVRKMRDYKRAVKEREEAEARIKSLETLGTMDIDEIIERGATILAKTINEVVPEMFARKTVALAIKMAIPKSPRGRKPAHHTT